MRYVPLLCGTMSTLTADMTVGKRIKWARNEAGLSQEKLAATIGTTRQVIIRWERDKHLPNALSRDRLAEALDQEADFFADTEVAPNGAPFRSGSSGGADAARAGASGEAGVGEGSEVAA